MQSVTMLMMQLDIVFLVILPLRYRLINTTPYVIKMLIPGFAFGIFFAVWGWLHVDEEVLIFCNPPVALVPHISHIWMASNLVVNSFVLCLLVVIIVLMYTRGKQQGDKCRSDTQQIVLRLKVISAIFVFSWYSATLGHTIINSLFDEGTLSTVLSSNMIFFALIIFSQSFYVILWRSREYRKAFFSMYSENFLLRRLSSIGATVSSTRKSFLVGSQNAQNVAIFSQESWILKTPRPHMEWLKASRKRKYSPILAYLQCANSTYHFFCLLCELFNAYFLIFGIQLRRDQCYRIQGVYIFLVSMQTVAMLMMLVDILTLVLLPMRYRTIETGPYVVKMCLPGFIYGLFFAVWGWLNVDDEVLIFCNPPIAMVPAISHAWMQCNFAINSTVLGLLILVTILMYYRGKGRNETQRVIRRLKVITVIFVFSWYSATLGHNIINNIFEESTLSVFLNSNMIFFVLIIYSQAFYVIMWRSKEYRSAFVSMYSTSIPYLQKFAPSTITVTVTNSAVQPSQQEATASKKVKKAAATVG
ncbi:unnamed protein product [Caenorhabditis auriculariae]|uniref:Uncharacterized protein n=1 Tax=Caenorhabditis auriculariae TaxID=2777116 RepID=A0A8S1HSS0_9PELO|nr:unnamed protein product [Caenorhabditis auriculariae]